jgi:hypothetical protein
MSIEGTASGTPPGRSYSPAANEHFGAAFVRPLTDSQDGARSRQAPAFLSLLCANFLALPRRQGENNPS